MWPLIIICFFSQKIIFLPNFYHPLVNPNTGELYLGNEFEKWIPETSHIYHVLHYLRCVFNDLSVESLNASEASKLANPEVAQT